MGLSYMNENERISGEKKSTTWKKLKCGKELLVTKDIKQKMKNTSSQFYHLGVKCGE